MVQPRSRESFQGIAIETSLILRHEASTALPPLNRDFMIHLQGYSASGSGTLVFFVRDYGVRNIFSSIMIARLSQGHD